jgi:group I intron endonuclease
VQNIFPHRPGVYVIKNTLNNKVYIGSTCDLKQRKWGHLNSLSHSNHRNKNLQRDWNIYGSDIFIFEIMLYCSKEDLILFEQKVLDLYKDNRYNVLPFAGLGRGVTQSEEVKARISASKIGHYVSKETRKIMGDIHRGLKWSDEHRNKFINSMRKRRENKNVGAI